MSASASAITVVSPGTKSNFLGTLRGRLGWTPSAPWLLYVTGGLAYGHTETEVALSTHISGLCGGGALGCPDASGFASKDDWRAGWTVGGGVEWMFAPRWSFKAEYLYYDLGHVNLNTSDRPICRHRRRIGTTPAPRPFIAGQQQGQHCQGRDKLPLQRLLSTKGLKVDQPRAMSRDFLLVRPQCDHRFLSG